MTNEEFEQVRGMIIQLAARAWKSIPCYAQVWVSIPDLIQFAVQELAKRAAVFNPAKSKWSTFVYTCVQQTMINEVHKYYAPKYTPPEPAKENKYEEYNLYEQAECYQRLYRDAGKELRGVLSVVVGVPNGDESLEYKPIKSLIKSLRSFDKSLDLSLEMSSLSKKWSFTIDDARCLRRYGLGEFIKLQEADDRHDLRGLPPDVQ